MEPVKVPFALGVKVTLIVQEAAGFRVAPQVFVWANGPVAAMLATVRIPRPVFVRVAFMAGLVILTVASIAATVRIPRPVFVRVAFMAGLVVLIIWLGKVRPLGENVTAGNTPVPVSGSV